MQLELFRLFAPPVDTTARPHHVIIGGRLIAYRLHRNRRRLSLRIDDRGLHAGAPRGLSLAEIEVFIHQHGEWVVRKLDELATHHTARHLSIHEGARIPLLGGEARIRLTQGGNRGLWQGDELWLAARPQADLALLARRALQRRALEHFRPRVAETARRIDRPAPALSLSAARTRWGSCSASGGIRLNWRLIHLATELGDYVVAHEVAHLLEMNHGPRFWAIVAELFPDWQAARAALRRQGATLPLI